MSDSSSSPFTRALLRGTIFFSLLLLFEVFWGPSGEGGLTASNVVFAGIAAALFVVVMHFIDQKSGRDAS